MNKALHALVYVFLALAATSLYFELQLNQKRALLTDRNRLQEDYLVKISKTIECEAPAKDQTFEIKKDDSAVEAKIVDSPDMRDLLEDYPASLEQTEIKRFNWDNMNDREALRRVYVVDAEGNPMMDGTQAMVRGSDEDKMLEKLFNAAMEQQKRLNTTRAALPELRAKLEEVTDELNKLKPEARQDKVTIFEKEEKINKLEGEKADLENQIVKIKGQIDDLNSEITSLKDEVNTAKEETEITKEELEKSQKLVDQLKKIIADQINTRGGQSADSAITQIPIGDKGKVVDVDNVAMFAIIELSDAAMKELKGEDLQKPLPHIELGVKRPGHKGDAGEFIGKIRLRQEVKGKNYIVGDILSAWTQDEVNVGDVVFSD